MIPPKPRRAEQIADWLCYLVQAGVYPPHSVLPAHVPLARSLVSATPDVVAGKRLLADRRILRVRPGHPTRVRDTLPCPVAVPPGLDGLAAALDRQAVPGLRLSTADIQTDCSRARTWWAGRTVPPKEAADLLARRLITAAAQLVPHAAAQPGRSGKTLTLLRRTAVTALAEPPADLGEHIWRLACLSALLKTLCRTGSTPTAPGPPALQPYARPPGLRTLPPHPTNPEFADGGPHAREFSAAR